MSRVNAQNPRRSSTVRRCKDCVNDGITSIRNAPHPGPRCTTHHRAFRKATRARSTAKRRQKVYGVTPELFEALWALQGRVCAACGRPIRNRPCIDHDHDCCPGATSCGKCVRGILHPDCNRTLIGRFSVDQLIRAARYLLDPPGPRIIGPLDEESP